MPSTNPTDPTSPQPQFVDAFEVRFIGRAVRRHGGVVLMAVLIGAIAGAGLRLFSPPVYRADAVLLVNIHSIKIATNGVPMNVELVRPTRRLVGTICMSDRAMLLLAERLGEGADEDPGADMSTRVASVRSRVYYDQRGPELAALRAVGSDPEAAARLANEWAEVCQVMLREAYGTTAAEVEEIERLTLEAKQQVLLAMQAVGQLGDGAGDSIRLERSEGLDRSRKLLGALNERWAQLRVRQADSEEIAQISSLAIPPADSINPSARLIIGLFAFAGLLIGLAVALLRGPDAAV